MLQCMLLLQILRVLKASQINDHHNTGLWEWLLVGGGCGTNDCTIDVEHDRAVSAAVMDVSTPL